MSRWSPATVILCITFSFFFFLQRNLPLSWRASHFTGKHAVDTDLIRLYILFQIVKVHENGLYFQILWKKWLGFYIVYLKGWNSPTIWCFCGIMSLYHSAKKFMKRLSDRGPSLLLWLEWIKSSSFQKEEETLWSSLFLTTGMTITFLLPKV